MEELDVRRMAAVVALALVTAGMASACQRPGGKATTPHTATAEATAVPGAALTDSGGDVTSIELLTPGSAYATPTPLIRWTPVDGAAAYVLRIDDSEECTSPLQSYTVTGTVQAAEFLQNGVYYACLVAKSGAGAVLARGGGRFWVLAHDVADAREQNGHGGSGAAVQTPELVPYPLFQDDWTARLSNRGGAGPRRDGVADISAFGVYADPHAGSRLRLVVNDRGNHRVLAFDAVPNRPGDAASVVVGQSDFDAGRPNAGEGVANSGFADNVHASVCTDGKLLVTDRGNNRVLVWRHIPEENGAPADFVLGQATFAGSAAGGGALGLRQPAAAFCVGAKLLIVDRGNNRIVVFDAIPTRSGAAADYAIGQPDLTGGVAACDADRLSAPADVLLEGGRFYIADAGNNRVVVYDGLPTGFGARATAVLGQTNLARCLANRGGVVSAATLAVPTGLASRGHLLAVADGENQRVLLYALPAVTGQAAQAVLGQADAASVRHSDVPEMGAFDQPRSLLFDGNFLWVGDSGNKRLAVVPLPL